MSIKKNTHKSFSLKDLLKLEKLAERAAELNNKETDDEESEVEEGDAEETEVEEKPVISEESKKLDKLIADFKVFSNKVMPMLEALMAAQRIAIGIKNSETPRVSKEKKANATLNTACGKIKTEVASYLLKLDAEGVLHCTSKVQTIKKGRAVEEELEVEGKLPNGDWIIVEKSDNYYLVSTENFENATKVTPYGNDEESNETSKQGIILNKKGIANKCSGYELIANEDSFKLTKSNLEKTVKVFNARWTKDCDNSWPITGEAIPEGHWVIVTDEDDRFFLVDADDVEAKVSTKKTEKKISKKVATKKISKKIEKKVSTKKVSKKKSKK